VRPEVRLLIGRIEGDLEDLRRVVERATRFVVDQAVPEGPHWHEELLPQASLEIPSLRPAVLRRSTRDCLDEYRRFRHVVRNVYAFVFDRARLRELARGLPKCFEMSPVTFRRFGSSWSVCIQRSPVQRRGRNNEAA
jgi:hypothetical protein